MHPVSFQRAGGGLAVASAVLSAALATVWAVASGGPTTSPPDVLSLAPFVVAAVALPALGGVWMWRGHAERAPRGAMLVAAIGTLAAATIPARLATTAALPAEWQLIGLGAPLLLALAAGCAAAGLLGSSSVRWSLPWSHPARRPRLILLAATAATALALHPSLVDAARAAADQGLAAATAQLLAIPAALQALTLIGVAAIMLVGVAAASIRPPALAAVGALVLAGHGLVHALGQATSTPGLSLSVWLAGSAGLALAASAATLATTGRSLPRAALPPRLPGHAVVFYDHEAALLTALHESVDAGLAAGDVCVVVATGPHRDSLEQTLAHAGWDVAAVQASGHYIPADAAETLASITVNDTPNSQAFHDTVTPLIASPAHGDRRVRIYGEMVTLLWDEGDVVGALALEELWNELGAAHPFSLLCPYPTSAFDGDDGDQYHRQVCELHDTTLTTPHHSPPAADADSASHRT